MTYHGWDNYPTWVPALYIDNCPYTHDHWHGRAKDLAGELSVSVHWTQEASARFRLADELKELTGQELYDHENPAPLEDPMDWEK